MSLKTSPILDYVGPNDYTNKNYNLADRDVAKNLQCKAFFFLIIVLFSRTYNLVIVSNRMPDHGYVIKNIDNVKRVIKLFRLYWGYMGILVLFLNVFVNVSSFNVYFMYIYSIQ